MRIIGVTGGIGSGKSTVAITMRDLGAAVIDADVTARSVTCKGGKALEELSSYFGSDILVPNGELDRKKLASLVFNDKIKLEALNEITHKYIIDRIKDNIESIKMSGKTEVIVLEASIPLEHGFLDLVDEVWLVTADREIRIKRVMDRNGFTYDEALSRIDSQKKDEEYLKTADVVINNNDSMEELEQTVVKLFIQKKQDRLKQG